MKHYPLPLLAFLSLAITGFLSAGCATPPPTRAEESNAKSEANERIRSALIDSSIDISYVLGHSHRRLLAWAKHDSCGGQTYLDHQILKFSEIEATHYREFFGKAEQFVNSPKRKPADQGASGQQSAPLQANELCRTPFTVTLRLGADTKIMQGCRGSDDGLLSRLVRDGEFLLYSNK